MNNEIQKDDGRFTLDKLKDIIDKEFRKPRKEPKHILTPRTEKELTKAIKEMWQKKLNDKA